MNIDRLKEFSLAQIEAQYRYGSVTTEELVSYLKLWNDTPCRFTVAEWRDGAIRQTVKP